VRSTRSTQAPVTIRMPASSAASTSTSTISGSNGVRTRAAFWSTVTSAPAARATKANSIEM
jgi:hypothetical protein